MTKARWCLCALKRTLAMKDTAYCGARLRSACSQSGDATPSIGGSGRPSAPHEGAQRMGLMMSGQRPYARSETADNIRDQDLAYICTQAREAFAEMGGKTC